ncbi:MAG TPA: L-threonylcarbamoyladenylate synthase [Flavobacteriales bacterium]|nr:L-threonylcarbamoyladenylate synthase [Flavobacteriales bacterium]HPH82003.1 L-threonylcarbamoyladenylate synthase [Flavobacteriales bacterium]
MAIIGTDIHQAAQLLQNEVIGIPTETVYGLAGNAYNADLVARIFDVKQRPTFDPLIVHTSSIERISDFAQSIPDALMPLAEKFWPGPLTLLVERIAKIPDLVSSGLPHVAVRIPNHPLTLQLLDQLEFPLAAPSANPFGYVSPTTAQHVNDQLGDKIPFILDGGACQVGLESTIVGLIDGVITVFRLGGLSLESIEGVVGKVQVRSHSSNPQAPGMLDSHYSPRKKVLLGIIPELLKNHRDQSPVLIRFSSLLSEYPEALQLVLSPKASVSEAAINLFKYLRLADQFGTSLILAELVPEIGLGRAINDRLKRAAFH